MTRESDDAQVLIGLLRMERQLQAFTYQLQALTYQLELHGLGAQARPAESSQIPTRDMPDDGN